jgi:hypothetical protein
MEPAKMTQQMIEFQKTAVESSFQAMALFQGHAEKVLQMVLNQAAWLPEGSKKALDEWTNTYKKGCEGFKQAVDMSFARAENFFSDISKAQMS